MECNELGSWTAYCSKYHCPVEADCKLEQELHSPAAIIGKRLNLGCAKNIKPYSDGWVNTDISRAPGVDVSCDFNQTLPFPSDYFEYIWASHIFEHLTNFPGAVKECARVLKKGGILEVYAPYGVGWHNPDPYHVRALWPASFDYFTRGEKTNTTLETDWTEPLFKIEKCEILRIFPYRQYLTKLGLRFLGKRYTFPLGIKVEIHWQLRRL